ncbi:MAG: hypothetical protein ACFUZC_10365 [Chthoniobacteraceae bacterium]
MDTQEQIQELERQIENLRGRAVMELKVKLVEARNRVVEIQKEIAELTGSTTPNAARLLTAGSKSLRFVYLTHLVGDNFCFASHSSRCA